MYENLLPLGSVVLLNGGNKRLMVVSRISANESSDKVYDYVGCPYPEGFDSSKMFYFFDHDAIERIDFIGFQDPEELRFREEVLANLGEMYVNENGEIVERKAEDEAPADEVAEDSEPEAAPVPDEDTIEVAVFADVD